MQIVELTLDRASFCCPVTGTTILGLEGLEPSSATMFVYVDELDDFEFLSDELQPIWESVQLLQEDESFEGELFEEFVPRVEGDTIVCFELAIREAGCGPACSRIRIGIEMNHWIDDQDEESESD